MIIQRGSLNRPYAFVMAACVALLLAIPAVALASNRLPNVPLPANELNAASSVFVSSPVILPSGASEAITDGSFEGGSPNAFWNESSTNFGTPLCTVALCGTGTGTGPHTGLWWSWFGGISAYEEGSVDQDIVIPVGATTLTFWLEQIACDSAQDYLEINIDGNQVFITTGDSQLCGVLGYAEQSVDVSAYADGGMHNIEFYSEIFAANQGGSNFFVDDVSLQADEVVLPDDATFTVSKDFTDGNTGEIDVTLNCFQGLPLTQTQGITEAQSVEFTVQSFAQGTLDCNVTESDSTGYSGSYDDGDGVSAVNCSWADLTGGDYACRITNSPDSVEVVVSKEWVLDTNGGGAGNVLDAGYSLVLWCNNPIDGYDGYNYGQYYKTLYNGASNGTSDVEYSAFVTPKWDVGTDCSVSESPFDSAVESHNGCNSLHVELGVGDSCTIVNSVFFEGIPSLNQYGLAILALLMLGVGFVGFRRFV